MVSFFIKSILFFNSASMADAIEKELKNWFADAKKVIVAGIGKLLLELLG